MTRVVHCKKHPYDVYVGRGYGSIWGNPFTHSGNETLAAVAVPTRFDAVNEFRRWLAGSPEWAHIEPERREQILARLPELKGKTLGCWCAPKLCHGTILADMADNL